MASKIVAIAEMAVRRLGLRAILLLRQEPSSFLSESVGAKATWSVNVA
jgi:hypothetical protein